jgi:hypothetical protein
MKTYGNTRRAASGNGTRAELTRFWNEFSVYSDSELLGYIVDRNSRVFEARNTDHRFVGNFTSVRKAMRALEPAP